MLCKIRGVSTIGFVIVLSLLSFIAYKMYTTQKSHEVVLIAGTSSAGKTSIINELIKIVPDYTVVSADTFYTEGIPKVLQQKAKQWGWDDKKSSLNDFLDNNVLKKTGKYRGMETALSTGIAHDIHVEIANAVYIALFEYAKKEAQKNNIIIDTVFDFFDNYDQFSTVFKNNKQIKILVYCPLDVVYKRVEKRNLTGKPEEKRTTIQAFTQFAAIYKKQDSPQDQVIDKINSKQMLQLLKIAIDDSIKTLKSDIAEQLKQSATGHDIINAKLNVGIESLHNFNAAFIKRFKLDESDEIAIVPINRYDLIINSATERPLANAQQIARYLKIAQRMEDIMEDVIIKKSNIGQFTDGFGVFANRDFNKGEVVIKWHLKKMSLQEYNALSEYEKNNFCHVRQDVIYLYPDPERHVNRSRAPNVISDMENQANIALRDIKEGEELSISDSTIEDY